jgi:hypothetical protein
MAFGFLIKFQRTLLIAALCVLYDAPICHAQGNSYNFIEPGYQLTNILGSMGSFIEIEAGRQASGGFSYGATIHFLISDIQRTSGSLNESMSSLWYLGPRIQYSSSLNENLSVYGGSTIGIGTTNYEEAQPGLVVSGGFLIGIRPEGGIRLQISERIRVNAGVNMLYGIIGSRSNIVAAPAARIGLRLGK